MTTAYEVPFSPGQPQTFLIQLSGVTYRLTVGWNGVSSTWTLDIADADGEPIVTGIPIVTGVDLLKQYGYLGIGGQLFVQSSGDVTLIPGYNDLGDSGQVFFVTEP